MANGDGTSSQTFESWTDEEALSLFCESYALSVNSDEALDLFWNDLTNKGER